MADPLSLAVLSMTTSLAGLVMRGAAVAVDPSWSSAASLPGDALNAWRSIWSLMHGRGGQENPLEASIKSQLQKQVDAAGERHERTGVAQSALAGAVTEMEVALKELSRDDDAVIEAVRFPDHFERYLRRRTAGRRQNVEAAAESFFDDLTRIVADEFIHLAPGSCGFDIAAFKQLLTGRDQLIAGQNQLLKGQAETNALLEAMDTDIKEIHSAVTRNHSALPTRIRFGSRPRVTAGFVKREEQDKLFEAVLTCAEPRTVLTGMRGSGKTQLAATVATRCEEEGWPLVAWIDADSRDRLITNLYNLALQAGIEAPKDVPPETIVQRFLDQLRSADAEDRLFVFDNVENLDDLKGLAPEGDGARIIITTTRHLDWDSLGWFLLTVGVFKREQSIALLCERNGDTDRDAADQIAEALGDLPVAVTQAAATAKWGGYTLSGYLNMLRNHPLDSSISRFEGDDYPDAVGIVLFMAYEQAMEQIRTKHPQQEKIAISLLGTLSLLAASGVPTHWLLAVNNDSDTVRDTLSFLKRSSILQESTDGNKIIIHRLQGQVYRETYLSEPGKFNEACTYGTTILNKIDIDQLTNFEQQRQETRNLVEQIGAITLQGHSHPLFSNPNFIASLATTLRNATDLGMPQLALTLTDSVTKAVYTLGPDHSDTLSSRNNLANAYQDAGKLEEAITLYEQNLKDFENLLGPDHPETLTSRNNLANAYQDAGRLNEAIELLQQSLTDHTHILGPNHPNTLLSRNNLANAYQDAGRLNEAIVLYEQALTDSTHILGPNHLYTLAAQSNLANAYRDSGRLDKAIELLQQSLTDRTRILGLEHPDTLLSRSNLAGAYLESGRLDKAIELLQQTLEDHTRILGPSHPNTLISRNNLANAYQATGRLDDAIYLHHQNLDDRTRILGPHHPHTFASRNNLAYAYQDVGRLDEAIPLLEQSLKDCTRILGSHHPDTLTSRNNLASAYWHAGRLDKAITLLVQNLDDRIRILGPDHPDTLTSRNNLAHTYLDADRLEEAITLLEQNFTDCSRILGPLHPHTLNTRHNLAYAYQTAGRLHEAIPQYEQNLKDSTRILGPDHPDTLTARHNLAEAYRATGRIEAADKLFETPLVSEDEQDSTDEDQKSGH